MLRHVITISAVNAIERLGGSRALEGNDILRETRLNISQCHISKPIIPIDLVGRLSERDIQDLQTSLYCKDYTVQQKKSLI